jgi:hypothetical protein
MNFTLLLFVFMSLMPPAFAAKKVAVVKLLKGEVEVLTMGKTSKLKVEDWVEDGSVVKTAEKSFVKLVFIDKSQMNIGPGSEMKIEKFTGKDSGVIDLVKGKIRSQVTKDYLQIERDKSKLFIKTKNAVMGVRGTDFIIATNGISTSTILFEGAIAFNHLESREEVDTSRLEEIVNRGVSMFPGEFSVVEGRTSQPTIPSLINVHQREALEKSQNFEGDRSPQNTEKVEFKKGVVPVGLDGKTVGNDASVLKKEIAISNVIKPTVGVGKKPASLNPNSYTQGGRYKPANGSFLHVDSGVIIAPPPQSVYDPNTNTYIPAGSGSVSSNGSYIPPSNMEITNDGKVLVSNKDESGQVVIQEVDPTATMKTTTTSTTSKTGTVTTNTTGDFSTYKSDTTTVTGGNLTPGTTGQVINPSTTRTTIIINN